MITKQTWLIGDVRLLLDQFDEFHLVVTSPPYNIEVDYGVYKDNLPTDEYISFLTDVFIKISKKLAPGGHICINIANTGRQPYLPKKDLLVCSLLKSWDLQYRGEIIWDKQNMTSGTAWGSWLSANCPSLRDHHEYILIFRKDGDRKGESDMTDKEFMSYTNSMWKVQPDSMNETDHPAPYPLELVMRLIKLYSFIGETVFDPFLGTGTTLRACKLLNRNGAGCEINPAYEKIIDYKSMSNIPSLECWNTKKDAQECLSK